MDYVRQTYVLFFSPERYLLKRYDRPVKSRDPSKIRLPKHAFAFRFFDLVTKDVIVDGKKMELKSEQFNHSPKYYCGGQLYTLDDVKREFPDKRDLISYMKSHCYKRVVHYSFGDWRPLEAGDVFLETA